MMAAPERGQHFVPRFYLKKFLATDIPASANKELWVADLVTSEVRLRSPRSVAKRDYFYEEQKLNSSLPRIETMLKAVEDRAAKVLRATEAGFPPAAAIDVGLHLYIALQVARTPQARQMMAAHVQTAGANHDHPPWDPTPRPRDPLLAMFWDVARHLQQNPSSPDAPLLNTIVRAVRDLLPKLWRSETLPFEAPAGFAYTTSDQPAMIYVHENACPEEAHAGRGTVHVLFPQSPKLLLIFCLDPGHCIAPNIHRGLFIDQVNDLVVLSAESQVFSSTRRLAERALERAEEIRTLRRFI